MQHKIKHQFVLFLGGVLWMMPVLASAHQPRLVESSTTVIIDPEISKAYYAQPDGQPQNYHISSDKPFELYVNILVPDREGQAKDVKAIVTKEGRATTTLAVLNAEPNSLWKRFWEPFGRDWYWQGEEYKSRAEAGEYNIQVVSPQNMTRYSLAIGEAEKFDAQEGVHAALLIPRLKRDFFGKSPLGFILSPFGIGFVLLLLIAAFIVGGVLRGVRHTWKRTWSFSGSLLVGPRRRQRIFFFLLGSVMLMFALLTSWNPILIFVAGLCLFSSVFPW